MRQIQNFNGTLMNFPTKKRGLEDYISLPSAITLLYPHNP